MAEKGVTNQVPEKQAFGCVENLRITSGRSAVWAEDKALTKVGRGDRAELAGGKSDPSPEQRDKCCGVPFDKMSRVVTFIERDNRILVAGGWGRENGGFNGCRVLVYKMKKVLELGCTTV